MEEEGGAELRKSRAEGGEAEKWEREVEREWEKNDLQDPHLAYEGGGEWRGLRNWEESGVACGGERRFCGMAPWEGRLQGRLHVTTEILGTNPNKPGRPLGRKAETLLNYICSGTLEHIYPWR
jgi:hypothetical protein